MSRVESAAAGIVTECMLRGGRAMTLGCRMMDDQLWRVECERVDTVEDANVTREQLRAALSHATNQLQVATQTIAERLEASQAHRWVETLEAIKSGLRAIYEALGGEGQPENVKAVVNRARTLAERAEGHVKRISIEQDASYQVYSALRNLHEKLGGVADASHTSLDLIREIDEQVQASFREMSEVRS
jgi:DNA repair ATPase RecN